MQSRNTARQYGIYYILKDGQIKHLPPDANAARPGNAMNRCSRTGDRRRDAAGTWNSKQRSERTKQWLWRYRDAKQEALSIEAAYEELMEIQSGARAIRYSDMPKGGGSQADLSDVVALLEQHRKLVEDVRQKQAQAYKEIWEVIHQLPIAVEVSIMICRYLKQMKWEEICKEVGIEWAQVHRHHGRALRHISEIIGEQV